MIACGEPGSWSRRAAGSACPAQVGEVRERTKVRRLGVAESLFRSVSTLVPTRKYSRVSSREREEERFLTVKKSVTVPGSFQVFGWLCACASASVGFLPDGSA